MLLIDKKKDQKGFTMIEVLMVLTVVIIVAILVTNNISDSLEKARDTERRLDILALQEELESHWHTHQSYPTELSNIIDGLTAAYLDPDGAGVNNIPATTSENQPIPGYTAQEKPEFQYAYAPYQCSSLEQEASKEDDTENESENEETDENEIQDNQEFIEPTCEKYVIYSWLEQPVNEEEPYFLKSNIHNADN